MTELLNTDQQKTLARVRSVVTDLRTGLAGVPANTDDAGTIKAALEQLDDFFLLVVVGEFNAGKSALINALLGASVLDQGVTPTTSSIQILRHTAQRGEPPVDGVRMVAHEAEFLRDIHLVDTPGTNAITREHEVLTQRFVPRADLILFVTSADHPFTESEHLFMERIREWGKKVVIVINKADIVETPEDLDRIHTYVRESVQALLHFAPQLFPVSAKMALEAKRTGDDSVLAESRLPVLERFILDTLNDTERFRLKLLNPLGVGQSLLLKYRGVIADRLRVLDGDVTTVEEIRSMLVGFQRDLGRGLELRLSEIDNLLHQFEKRGNDFFEETVRVGRLFDLVNRSKVRADFEQQVVGHLPREIEQTAERVIDWLVACDLQQWQDVRERLVRRQSEQSERMAGRLAGGFDYDRSRLLDTVGASVQTTLEQHDQRAEAVRIASSVQGAVANAALLEVGAVGLGAIVSLLATSTAVDVTGILAAGLLATVGFFILPRRRRQAKRELADRIARLRTQLSSALTTQFETETVASVRRIEDAIAPYVQFVEGERERLQERADELEAIDRRVMELQSELGQPRSQQP